MQPTSKDTYEADMIAGLHECIKRTVIRFSPNHELDGMEPEVDYDNIEFYATPITGEGHSRSGGTIRAKFWIVFGEVDNAPEDGGPYCINVPVHAWMYGWSSKNKACWKLSDRAAVRIIHMMWKNFGYVLY
jgi:hypothetical protein